MELLILLLPVAAASGWLAAKRSQRRAEDPGLAGRNPTYFQGLNYLLNEQQDKAIDVFIRMLEVNSDTVETHLALGNLFRKRGEVDRAIRIHQNLVARSNLSDEQRFDALLGDAFVERKVPFMENVQRIQPLTSRAVVDVALA